MKNCKKKCDSMSALRLALIITGSIVAAAGVILLIVKLCKKKSHTSKACECHDDFSSNDSWDIDEDALGDLELDDDCDCDCCCGANPEQETEEASAPASESEEPSEE